MNVTLTADDGRTYDITEHFQVMYDNLVGGMDWGSGFLDGGEALTVMQVGAAAGFDVNVANSSHMIAPVHVIGFDNDPSEPANYTRLVRAREQWIKDNIGDPPTWDSIAAYRERLVEMENTE